MRVSFLVSVIGLMLSFSRCIGGELSDSLRLSKKSPEAIVNRYLDSLQHTTLTESVHSERAQQAMDAYYRYRIQGYEQRQRTFEWQLWSSKIIFFVVIGLVLTGVFFAGVQFYLAYKLAPRRGKAASVDFSTELTASAKEIKVSSPVLGVIILLISFLFFYLYLKFVYPISEIM